MPGLLPRQILATKIYSLLGPMNIGIEADYSKSAQEIYREAATILFHGVPRDQWFKTGIGFGDRMPGLPSWVVDWDALQKGGWSATIAGNLYHADSSMTDLSSQTKIHVICLQAEEVLVMAIAISCQTYNEHGL